jgi:hypothetical protein
MQTVRQETEMDYSDAARRARTRQHREVALTANERVIFETPEAFEREVANAIDAHLGRGNGWLGTLCLAVLTFVVSYAVFARVLS